MTIIMHFDRDDDAYRRWLVENPTGFVVNSWRNPKAKYLRLHRAGCPSISSPSIENFTTNDYIKHCSTDRSVLERWAIEKVGGPLQPCKHCSP